MEELKSELSSVFLPEKQVVVNAQDTETADSVKYKYDVQFGGKKPKEYLGMVKMPNNDEYVKKEIFTPDFGKPQNRSVTTEIDKYSKEKEKKYVAPFVKGVAASTIDMAYTTGSGLFNIGQDIGASVAGKKVGKKIDITPEVQRAIEQSWKVKEEVLSALNLNLKNNDSELAYNMGSGISSLLQSIGLSAATKSTSVAAMVFGLRSTAGSYEELRQKGVSPFDAMAISASVGFNEGMLEKIGLHNYLETISVKRAASSFSKAFAVETVQEGSQTASESILMAPYRDTSVQDILKNIAYDGGMGGLVGLFGAGVWRFASRGQRQRQSNILQKHYNMSEKEADGLIEDAYSGNEKAAEQLTEYNKNYYKDVLVQDYNLTADKADEVVSSAFLGKKEAQAELKTILDNEVIATLENPNAEQDAVQTMKEGQDFLAKLIDQKAAGLSDEIQVRVDNVENLVKQKALDNGLNEEDANAAGSLAATISRNAIILANEQGIDLDRAAEEAIFGLENNEKEKAVEATPTGEPVREIVNESAGLSAAAEETAEPEEDVFDLAYEEKMAAKAEAEESTEPKVEMTAEEKQEEIDNERIAIMMEDGGMSYDEALFRVKTGREPTELDKALGYDFVPDGFRATPEYLESQKAAAPEAATATETEIENEQAAEPVQEAQEQKLPEETQKQVDDLFTYAETQEGVSKSLPLFSNVGEQQPKIEKSYTASDNGQIVDVGDKLLGNLKRDTRFLSWDELEKMNDLVRAKNLTKNNIYPKPTIADLRAQGIDGRPAALVLYVYNAINAKPSKSIKPTMENQKRYFDVIKRTMDKTVEFAKTHQAEINAWDKNMLLNESLLRTVFPSDEKSPNKIFRANKEYNEEVLAGGGNKFVNKLLVSGYDLPVIDEIAAKFDEVKEEKEKTETKKEPWEKHFTIMQKPFRNGWYVVDSRGRSITRDLSFDTEEKAKEFAQKAYDLVKDHLKGEGDTVDFSDMRTKGLQRRNNNQNVNAQALVDTFGFRGINFGNWTKQSERQEFLNLTYDSLYDMADILNIPAKAIGLDGKLGLAFGAQGHAGAVGHFLPEYNEINLTRKNGAGSLAHEWWHALDFYFGDQSLGKDYSGTASLELKEAGSLRPETFEAIKNLYDKISTADLTDEEVKERQRIRTEQLKYTINYRAKELKDKFAKEKNSGEINKFIDELVATDKDFDKSKRDEYAEKFTNMLPERRRTWETAGTFTDLTFRLQQLHDLDESAASWKKSSEFFETARKLNKITKKGDYWTQKTELGARAFASYIDDKIANRDWKNYFLSGHSKLKILDENRFLEALFKSEGNSTDVRRSDYMVPIYPAKPSEQADIDQAFDHLFETLKTKETDKGIAFYKLGEELGVHNIKDYPIKQETRHSYELDVNGASYWIRKNKIDANGNFVMGGQPGKVSGQGMQQQNAEQRKQLEETEILQYPVTAPNGIELKVSDEYRKRFASLEKTAASTHVGENKIYNKNFDDWLENKLHDEAKDEVENWDNLYDATYGEYDTLEELNEEIADNPDNWFDRSEPFASETEAIEYLSKHALENIDFWEKANYRLKRMDSDEYEKYREEYLGYDRDVFFDEYKNDIRFMLEDNGFFVTEDESRVSDSRYLDVYKSEEAYDNDEEPFAKIRISDHDTHKFWGNHINLYTNKPVYQEINKLLRSFANGDFGVDETVYYQTGEELENGQNGNDVALSIDSQKEMADLSDEEFKDKMLSTLKGLKGKKIPNTSLGGDIEIRTSSIKKYKSFFADRNKRLIVPYVPQLLKNARFTKEDSYTPETEPNIKAYWKSNFPISIDGDSFYVHLTVREDNQGNFFWDAQVNETPQHATPATNPGDTGGSSDISEDALSITQGTDIVNKTYYQKAPKQGELPVAGGGLNFGTYDKQNPENKIFRVMGEYRAWEKTIELFKGRDATTLTHEMLHHYLPIYLKLLEDGGKMSKIICSRRQNRRFSAFRQHSFCERGRHIHNIDI